MKIEKYLRRHKTDRPQTSKVPTQAGFPISPEDLVERLDAIERELKAVRADAKFAAQIAYTVEEAAQLTRIGIKALRERCGSAAGEPHHIKAVHIGRRIVIPRSELLRHLEQQAR